jgi:hypothetical protein|eukprot:jgi/Chrpa1/15691/Chrysochromulina_OHIO_Genome00022210-RA
MASERVEALELAIAAWVGAVPRTTKAGQNPEGTRIAWVEALVGVVIGMAAGVLGMAAALMVTTEPVTMG